MQKIRIKGKEVCVSKLKLLEVELKGLPPTVNQMYRNAGVHVRYKTRKAKDFQKYAVAAMQAAHLVSLTSHARCVMEVKFFDASNRKWDLDNRLKALQDCLQMAGIIEDDSQIDFITVEREIVSGVSRTSVTVYSLLQLPDHV